jgi:hypothetical protein
MSRVAANVSLAGCLFALVSSTANAQDSKSYTKTATAGGVLVLGHYASVNPDCTSRGKTVVRVQKTPAHGAVVLTPGRGFTSFSHATQCNARSVEGVTAAYRPERGYVGPDAVGFDIIYPSGIEKFKTYDIEVK